MRATLRALRALRALVLLAGFPLLSLLPVAGLAALCWAAHLGAPTGVAVKLYVVSAVLAFLALRGLFMLRTPPGTSPAPGLSVTEDGEPALWRTVRELAEGTGTPAPAAVVLTGDAAASLSEDTRPRLLLGMPLIQGLSESQLRAVLAQEFARHAGHGLTGRCRTRVLLAVAGFRKDGGQSYRVMARGYTAYAKLYVRATLADTRRQEYEADAVAARLAGRDATASALREIPALRDAHDYYLGHYAELGHAAGLLPPPGEILGGFGRMLTARELELASLRMRHCDPTTAERVKRVKALPADGRTAEGKGAALSLLTDADRTYAELEAARAAHRPRHPGAPGAGRVHRRAVDTAHAAQGDRRRPAVAPCAAAAAVRPGGSRERPGLPRVRPPRAAAGSAGHGPGRAVRAEPAALGVLLVGGRPEPPHGGRPGPRRGRRGRGGRRLTGHRTTARPAAAVRSTRPAHR
jgi:Zn-dependent protease with chaperone function